MSRGDHSTQLFLLDESFVWPVPVNQLVCNVLDYLKCCGVGQSGLCIHGAEYILLVALLGYTVWHRSAEPLCWTRGGVGISRSKS